MAPDHEVSFSDSRQDVIKSSNRNIQSFGMWAGVLFSIYYLKTNFRFETTYTSEAYTATEGLGAEIDVTYADWRTRLELGFSISF